MPWLWASSFYTFSIGAAFLLLNLACIAASAEESVYETCKRLEAARLDNVLSGVIGYKGEWLVKPEFAEIDPIAPRCFKVRLPGVSTPDLLRITDNGVVEYRIHFDVLREHIKHAPKTNFRVLLGPDNLYSTYINPQLAFLFEERGKLGARDCSGKILVTPQFDELYPCEDFYLAAKGQRGKGGYREFVLDTNGQAIGKKSGYSKHEDLNEFVANRIPSASIQIPYQVLVSTDDDVNAIVDKNTRSIVAPCHVSLRKTPWFWYIGTPLGPQTQKFYAGTWKDESEHFTNEVKFVAPDAIGYVPSTRMQLFEGFLQEFRLVGMDRSEVQSLLGEGESVLRNGEQRLSYKSFFDGHGHILRRIEIIFAGGKASGWRYY